MNLNVGQDVAPLYFSMATGNLEDSAVCADDSWESDGLMRELPSPSRPRFISMATQNFEDSAVCADDSWESDNLTHELPSPSRPQFISMATQNFDDNAACTDDFSESDDLTHESSRRSRPRFISMATQNFEESVAQSPKLLKSDSLLFWDSNMPVEELLKKNVRVEQPTKGAARQDQGKLVKNEDDNDKHVITVDSCEHRKGVPIFRSGWGLGGLVPTSNTCVDDDSQPRSIGWGEWQGLPRCSTSQSDVSSARKSSSRHSTADFIAAFSKDDLRDTSETHNEICNDCVRKGATSRCVTTSAVGRYASSADSHSLEDAPSVAAVRRTLADGGDTCKDTFADTATKHAGVDEYKIMEDTPEVTVANHPLVRENCTLEDAPSAGAVRRTLADGGDASKDTSARTETKDALANGCTITKEAHVGTVLKYPLVGEDYTLEDAPSAAAVRRTLPDEGDTFKDTSAGVATESARMDECRIIGDTPVDTMLHYPLVKPDYAVAVTLTEAAKIHALIDEDKAQEDAPAKGAMEHTLVDKRNSSEDTAPQVKVKRALIRGETTTSEDVLEGLPEVRHTRASAASRDEGVSCEVACVPFHDVNCSTQAPSITGLYLRQYLKRAFARLRRYR